jgi:hypothetical protein
LCTDAQFELVLRTYCLQDESDRSEYTVRSLTGTVHAAERAINHHCITKTSKKDKATCLREYFPPPAQTSFICKFSPSFLPSNQEKYRSKSRGYTPPKIILSTPRHHQGLRKSMAMAVALGNRAGVGEGGCDLSRKGLKTSSSRARSWTDETRRGK